MNQKQALKAASKHIEELTDSNLRYKWDVQRYNEVIGAMIRGESPCSWCEDREECQLEAKNGPGCADWILMWPGKKDLEAVKKAAREDDADVPVSGADS